MSIKKSLLTVAVVVKGMIARGERKAVLLVFVSMQSMHCHEVSAVTDAIAAIASAIVSTITSAIAF